MSYNWATYQRATGCTKYGPAGAQALMTYLEDTFPDQVSMGICNCRSVRGGSSFSHHAECRAYDEGFAVFSGQTIGIETLELLGPHGKRLGIDHLIVNFDPGAEGRGDPRIYSASYPNGKTYTGAHPHKNHNHIGLTRNAGLYLTYGTLVDVLGPPGVVKMPDVSFTKGLTEAQWRTLYQRGIAKGSSEQAVIDYWVTNASSRTDAEHDSASASLFVELSGKQTGALQIDTEKVEVVKNIRLQ